jgi:hypothetical protein
VSAICKDLKPQCFLPMSSRCTLLEGVFFGATDMIASHVFRKI